MKLNILSVENHSKNGRLQPLAGTILLRSVCSAEKDERKESIMMGCDRLTSNHAVFIPLGVEKNIQQKLKKLNKLNASTTRLVPASNG
jgi:hypothetical protein